MNKTRTTRRSAWVHSFAAHIQSDAQGWIDEGVKLSYLKRIVGFQGMI